jgi:ABC-type multidrug transport system fused ATPase/permease subunit
MFVWIGQAFVLTIRQRVYGHLQRLSFAFHTRQAVGDLTARVTSDVGALQDLFVSGLKSLVTNVLLVVGMLAVMVAIDWQFTLAAAAVLPALGWLVLRFRPRVKRAAREAKRRERAMASLAQETLVSYRVVQAFGAEDFEDRRFASEGSQAMAARVQAGVLQARFAPSVGLTLAAGTALVVGIGAERALAHEISIGTLLVFLTYVKSMYAPMKQLAKASGQLATATVASELVVELLETDARVPERADARPAPRLRGEIELERVSFAYAEGRPALADVSLRISPGQRCVVVGATGAGKSTLASLVPRFLDPDLGVVRVDGVDVRELTLRSLRAQIAVVLQDAMLFRMTIRENIAYAMPEATEAQIVAAAKAAHAHEFVERLPDGYDTLVDERGGNLSGGQRQRLALARAFLRDAPILVLDEPTTGLDAASEALVLEAVERLARGRTTLTIAHRLATIERADLVVVLERGRIVDEGTHAALLARSARYRALCLEHAADADARRAARQVAG